MTSSRSVNFSDDKKVRRRPDRETRHLGDGLLRELDGQTFRLEPRALTDLAGVQQRKVFFLRTARRHGIPDAVAGRTGPVRAIEGKDPRRDFRITHAALDTGQLVTVETGLAVLGQDRRPARRSVSARSRPNRPAGASAHRPASSPGDRR